ncbi:hypothetical protein M569_16392, partial [Genlisea aurea]
PPPPEFDFRNEILKSSAATVAEFHPELLDLAEAGNLVLVRKSQYGPVPTWRSEFVEPEAIWIVGTSHISQESCSHVERVIKAVRPDNVVVELCRSRQVYDSFSFLFNRAGIMYSDENEKQQLKSNLFSLTGTKFFATLSRSINLGGQTALALRLLLATVSSKLSQQPFGIEFSAARKAAEEIGAQLVLGDRPIEITLERAWRALSWKEKLNLVSTIVTVIITSSQASMNTPQQESSSRNGELRLYEQLSITYPSLLAPMIHERDVFIAWSLKRSKAVERSSRVVGIVGKGHMNGVVYALISDQGNHLRFRDLAGNRPGSDSGWAVSVLRSLLRDTLVGIVLWVLYQQLK